MSPFLTKSDFSACFDCKTKLYYRKRGYPSALEDDEYMRFLADGGFMVEFVAKAQFPGGVDLAGLRDPDAAFARTRELLATDGTVLFEAAAIFDRFHVRTDILRRRGGELHLVEVKSSSLGPEDDPAGSPFLSARGEVLARWRDYLLDVTFQAHVVQQSFPDLKVVPHLCVVDRTHPVSAAETLERFTLARDKANPKARPVVAYHGDPAQLRGTRLLRLRDVSAEVEILMPEVSARAAELAALLADDGVIRVQEDVATKYRVCRTCDYRVAPGISPSGFRECWGPLADAEPNILDLHQVGRIAGRNAPDPVTAILRRGRASLLDLGAGDLGPADSPLAARRRLQWEALRGGGREVLPAALRDELLAHQRDPGWPLHFVDFEACDVALPHHAGLRPYERVAFQWSCHTVDAASRLTHAEWLNAGRDFPNFAFALSLRERLGEEGTIYTWSGYEENTLRRVLLQVGEWVQRDPEEAVRVAGVLDAGSLRELAAWLERLLGPEDRDGRRRSPRIRDLHQLALRHYFHPRMGGRTSIKVVLPAVWESDAALRRHPWFAAYNRVDAAGRPLDPHQTLAALPFGGDKAGVDAVRGGVGAVRVHQAPRAMLFPNPVQKIHWIIVPGSRGRPQCDHCGHVATPKEIPNVVPEFIGTRPLDAEADFVADAFTYGDCPRCGRGNLQLVLVPQKLFGDLVPADIPL